MYRHLLIARHVPLVLGTYYTLMSLFLSLSMFTLAVCCIIAGLFLSVKVKRNWCRVALCPCKGTEDHQFVFVIDLKLHSGGGLFVLIKPIVHISLQKHRI